MLIADRDTAFLRHFQAIAATQQGALAGTAGANDDDHLRGFYLQIDATQNDLPSFEIVIMDIRLPLLHAGAARLFARPCRSVWSAPDRPGRRQDRLPASDKTR